MYFGTIPILKRSVMSDFFCSIELPAILINSWQDIFDLNTEELKSIYDKIEPKFAAEAL